MYMLFGKMDNQTSRIVEISFWLSMHFAKNLEIFIFLNDCESFFWGGDETLRGPEGYKRTQTVARRSGRLFNRKCCHKIVNRVALFAHGYLMNALSNFFASLPAAKRIWHTVRYSKPTNCCRCRAANSWSLE